MLQDYKPIDCNFHDLILDRATKKVIVDLEYNFSNGIQKKETKFKDVYTKSGEEFLLIEEGEIIRLDQILSVDGIKLQGFNSCKIYQ